MCARERIRIAAQFSALSREEAEALHEYGALSQELADIFIENAIGTFSLPLGVATNFVINGRQILVPMAVEESSVLAAASHGAKLVRAGGGFSTSSSEPIMTGQIQLKFLHSAPPRDAELLEIKDELLRYANRGQDRLLARKGGAKDLTWYFMEEISSLVFQLHIHTGDAMGANIVNTMCEKVSVRLKELFPRCDLGLRILTNLSIQRLARASCRVPAAVLDNSQFSGSEAVERIIDAWRFAWYDVYRATTHNKGVMNGIDPVLIATGNDWRAVEAGAHAYCVQEGKYRPMTSWKKDEAGDLVGFIELPMAVGTVGGVTKLHPTAQAALKLLGLPTARELAEIACAVGLAQNLSALRALATEGIQQGHMALHQKNLELFTMPSTPLSSIPRHHATQGSFH
jgi:hydroxymethylglutaryl-CoA reductase